MNHTAEQGITLNYKLLLSDLDQERSKAHADFMQGRIEWYSLRMEGNKVIIETSEKISRTIIKLNQ